MHFCGIHSFFEKFSTRMIVHIDWKNLDTCTLICPCFFFSELLLKTVLHHLTIKMGLKPKNGQRGNQYGLCETARAENILTMPLKKETDMMVFTK